MDIRSVGDHECINCGECIDVCPTKAIEWKGGKFVIAPSVAVDIPSDATDAEKRELERQRDERNARISKRNNIVKTVTAAVMIAVLAFALIYYNFIDGKKPDEPAKPPVNNGQVEVETDGGEGEKTPPPIGTDVGFTCPELQIDLVTNGKKFNFDDYKDRIIVLNFWYTTCGPCVAELPHFDDVARKYADDITVVAVHGMFPETAPKFITEEYPDSPIVFLSDFIPEGDNTTELDRTGYYLMLGGVNNAYPRTVIIDEQGIITHVFPGAIDHATLENAVKEALGK
jgi:thiol-disulfide isomerase/thioredoxin